MMLRGTRTLKWRRDDAEVTLKRDPKTDGREIRLKRQLQKQMI